MPILDVFKPLLSKDERRQLSQEERRALKKIRRAERAAELAADLLEVGIDLGALEAAAREAILDIAGEVLPGEEKMMLVLDELAGRADEILVWHWAGPAGVLLEAADGPVLRGLVHMALAPYVQAIYDELAEAGAVAEAEHGDE